MKDSVGPFKALMIDWDGTLIDSLPLKIQNAGELFAERFDVSSKSVTASYSTHSGIPRRELFDRISLDCQGRTLSEDEYVALSSAFTRRNTARVAEEATLRKGTLDTLTQLKDRGVLLFISTSATPEEIGALATHFGLDQICTDVFGSRPGFSKGLGHVSHVVAQFDLRHKDLCGVGDDIQDMKLLSEAGVSGIGITGTRSRETLLNAGAVVVIDHLEEIVPHVV